MKAGKQEGISLVAELLIFLTKRTACALRALRLDDDDCDLAQSRDDLICSSLARFHRAFQVTLSVD